MFLGPLATRVGDGSVLAVFIHLINENRNMVNVSGVMSKIRSYL